MGHALGSTIQDLLTRWQRMHGHNALWLPGTDHAGIATQITVERELMRSEKKTRYDLGRAAFVERTWAWKEKHGRRIVDQMKAMGFSLDWARERFTMDEGLSRAVRVAFVQLHKEGLIYRARRLINWCTRCQTALSDLEVDVNDEKGVDLAHFLRQRPGGRDHPPRDDARRYRRRGPPRRRALQAPDRQGGRAPAHRAQDPGHRRRDPRRQGVRHRRGQGHPRPRLQRLRDRRAPQPAGDLDPRRRRQDHRARAREVLGPRRAGGAARRSSPTSPPRIGWSTPRITPSRSAAASAAGRSSSRSCRCNGSSRSRRSPSRRSPPSRTAAPASSPRTGSRRT